MGAAGYLQYAAPSGSSRSARRQCRSSRAIARANAGKPRCIDSMAAVPASMASSANAPPGYSTGWKSVEPTWTTMARSSGGGSAASAHWV